MTGPLKPTYQDSSLVRSDAAGDALGYAFFPKRLLVIVGVGFALLFATAIAAIVYGAWNAYYRPPTQEALILAAPVDGVQCEVMSQVAYHIHVHLLMYDGGVSVPLPSSIGIPGGEVGPRCFYWIHVHAATPNIIHIESPIHKTFTLGQFFDIWKATKSDADPSGDGFVRRLKQAARRGHVTVFVDKRRWTANYRLVPLTRHESITVEIGRPLIAPSVYRLWHGL